MVEKGKFLSGKKKKNKFDSCVGKKEKKYII